MTANEFIHVGVMR